MLLLSVQFMLQAHSGQCEGVCRYPENFDLGDLAEYSVLNRLSAGCLLESVKPPY
jgi:hypothetical protein